MESKVYLPIDVRSGSMPLPISSQSWRGRTNWRPIALVTPLVLLFTLIIHATLPGDEEPRQYYQRASTAWGSMRARASSLSWVRHPATAKNDLHSLQSSANPTSAQGVPGTQGLYFTAFVPTGQCDAGFYCRAFISLFTLPDHLAIMTGYRVVQQGDDDYAFVDVPKSTSARLANTTEEQALQFAQLAIDYFAKINYYNCSLDVAAIGNGILRAAKDVSLNCHNTADRHCYRSFDVGVC